MKHTKITKLITALSIFAMVACNEEGLLSDNFNELKITYQTGYVLPEDSVDGTITVDIVAKTVSYNIEDYDAISIDEFDITDEQVTELQALVAETSYFAQNPVHQMGISDQDHLNLELDAESYRIYDPSHEEAGQFILPHHACPIQALIRTWVEANNGPAIADDVKDIMLDDCTNPQQGPQ